MERPSSSITIAGNTRVHRFHRTAPSWGPFFVAMQGGGSCAASAAEAAIAGWAEGVSDPPVFGNSVKLPKAAARFEFYSLFARFISEINYLHVGAFRDWGKLARCISAHTRRTWHA